MDSSRMRTACFLTVSRSIPSGGRGVCPTPWITRPSFAGGDDVQKQQYKI